MYKEKGVNFEFWAICAQGFWQITRNIYRSVYIYMRLIEKGSE